MSKMSIAAGIILFIRAQGNTPAATLERPSGRGLFDLCAVSEFRC